MTQASMTKRAHVTDKRPAILVAVVVAGAAIFAATRSPDARPDAAADNPIAHAPVPPEQVSQQAPSTLPPGHPPLGDMPADHPTLPQQNEPKPEAGVTWTAPPRWAAVPHKSAMRIATYRIPKVAGEVEDAELSVVRAGGDVEQNAVRWVAQFDEPSRKSAKRETKTINGLKVHFVDVEGAYGGMSGAGAPGFALAGAIIETPTGLHFFKMTGPVKTVHAARAELDALVASVKVR